MADARKRAAVFQNYKDQRNYLNSITNMINREVKRSSSQYACKSKSKTKYYD